MPVLALVLPLLALSSERPGPGGEFGTCAAGGEGEHLQLACAPGGKITKVVFANYGQVPMPACQWQWHAGTSNWQPQPSRPKPTLRARTLRRSLPAVIPECSLWSAPQVVGSCDQNLSPGSCGANVSAQLAKACVGQSNCSVSCSNGQQRQPQCCTHGVGSCCGCAFSSAGAGSFFVNVTDPCPGNPKHQAFRVRCDNSAGPGPGTSVPVVVQSWAPRSLARGATEKRTNTTKTKKRVVAKIRPALKPRSATGVCTWDRQSRCHSTCHIHAMWYLRAR